MLHMTIWYSYDTVKWPLVEIDFTGNGLVTNDTEDFIVQQNIFCVCHFWKDLNSINYFADIHVHSFHIRREQYYP